MHKRKWKYIILIGILLIIIAGTFLQLHYAKKDKADNKVITQGQEEYIPDNTSYGYAYETIYSGKPYVPDILFEQPFKKTEIYMSNAKFISMKGTKIADPLIKKATEFTSAAFNVTYKDIDVTNAFNDILDDGIYVKFPSGNEVKGIKEVTDAIQSWYINSKTSMETDYFTDKCMIYYDENAIILRGLITFTVYESEDMETIKQLFDTGDVRKGEECSVVVEYYFQPTIYTEDYETYTISKINILSNGK